jgi:hypothetical protein
MSCWFSLKPTNLTEQNQNDFPQRSARKTRAKQSKKNWLYVCQAPDSDRTPTKAKHLQKKKKKKRIVSDVNKI